MWWTLLSSAEAGQMSPPCTNIVDVEVVLWWSTHDDLIAREAKAAAAELRQPKTVPPHAYVGALVASKDIDEVDPTRYTIIVQGPGEVEHARLAGTWAKPEVPDARDMWRNVLGGPVAGATFPAKVYVVDTIRSLRCIFFVEENGDARIATLPPVP